ncbi:uncharacterized protein LOC116143354 [Pistacia vera]|uniref:uncharacterized protein LOC116143354 n=1 Tax=Pistacia vera TaxID=55513 RepID=UPI001262DFFB|nr:uncharacterized protein LOC116143354 [Pistacia vera]
MNVKTICEQCGDRGVSVALIYCDKCQIAAMHRYCIPQLPVTFEEDVIWYCVDCERKVGKLPSVDNLNSVLPKKYDSRNLEIVRRAEISPYHHLEVHCSENHGEDTEQKFRRQRELDLGSSDEESESVKTKISGTATGDCQNCLVHGCELHCSEGDKINDKLEREIGLDGSSSDEEIESFKAKTSPLVTNDPTNILQYRGVENDKGDNNIRRQKLLVRDGFDEEIESKSSLVATSNSLNIPTQSSKARAELTTEVHCNQNDENTLKTGRQKGKEQGSPDEEAESAKHETSLAVTTVPSNINHSVYAPAQPISEPIWKGSLCLSNEKYSIVAHLSAMASSRVFEEAKRLPELLCLELLPRFDVWPKHFHKSGPSDDNIALYLFPMSDR